MSHPDRSPSNEPSSAHLAEARRQLTEDLERLREGVGASVGWRPQGVATTLLMAGAVGVAAGLAFRRGGLPRVIGLLAPGRGRRGP